MSYTEEDTIFVQIPCYRDAELLTTLEDMYHKAKRPENIFCGICLQIDLVDHEDDDLFERSLPRKEQLRIITKDYRDVKNLIEARSLAQDMYKDEKYILQIDSHMRFKDGWDEISVKEVKYLIQTTNHKAVALTQKPNAYKLNCKELNFETNPVRIGAVDVGGYELTRYGSSCKEINSNNICTTSATCGAFTFYNVMGSNYLRINSKNGNCDELTMSLLLFTNKYNIFLLNKMIVNHLHFDSSYMQNRNFVKARGLGHRSEKNSEFIVSLYLNIKKTKDPEVLQNINEYGLGNKRTLRDYERFSGVNFRKKIIKEHVKQGVFEEWQEVSKIVDVKKIFNDLKNS